MKNQTLINEVFWLRSIACIAVLVGHALKNGYSHFAEPSSLQSLSYLLYMAILFGVPVFVFISEFLLANKYSIGVPRGFLKKRLKILVLPYLFMSTIYSFFEVEVWNVQNILFETSKNIFLGESTIYFILIIFQFYLLHISFSKILSQLSPKIVLPISFIVNVLYLSVFNFVDPPDNSFAQYLWDPGYWMPFLGWIFYFTLGYYCGKSYELVLSLLRKYNKLVLCMPAISFSIFLVMNKLLLIDQNSKRIDMLLFATSMIFLIMYFSSFIKTIPRIIMLISNYSFSLFLLNQLFFNLLLPLTPPTFMNILSYSFSVFILSLLCSIIVAYFLNKFPFGKYLVGNIMSFKIEKSPSIKQSA
ncbi:MAG: acyltransferase family protein [Bacillus sp. (in: Bacteria)]|nr:acyltransferase family protein [Bacillus sp. (in: firmicutes)]